ncbi:alpha-glucosidase [Tepiditoga spiralis]|uniref:Alpha-glucosidase n=1 Tax=Tepiditoga spiralis TaxID=2108365 RepID=A0A7G1G520_9BACT|nr:TIM-barrel domain-containing protein [Tepiditoga spiralis]BBE31205.1 alpha-glucosidase [Tepiditoga spiralis]
MTSYKITKITNKFSFGNPFNTNAVINNYLNLKKIKKNMPFFEVKNENDTIKLTYKMNNKDKIYGLGEMMGGLNKRGKKYKTYSNDVPIHTPDLENLYGNHPFLIVDGVETFGFFIDFPGKIEFDIGFEKYDTLEIKLKNNFDIYIFEGKKDEIIKEYLKLTGSPMSLPKWAFGYQQSRWSYPDKKSIKEIAKKFREYKIPCDAIYMDIDYMKDYKIFTIDKEKFTNFEKFVNEMKNEGFKLVPIIDPGVKIEKNYEVYEEGIKNNYFCKDEKGNDFTAAVWPGLTHFPDFLNEKVRKWWGDLYKNFNDMGIRAYWNDMNEPAIFYTPERLKEAFEVVKNVKNNDNLGIDVFKAKDSFVNMPNNIKDYKSFYHNVDGENILHDEVHNLYGFNMARATAEGLKRLDNNKRYFLLSRSSYSGQQRFSAIWMGDNMSWWEHMLYHIRMMLNLNITGFFYTGADIGGFGGNTSEDLVIRWMQLGAFTPLFRNHSAFGTRHQEPWEFSEKARNIMKDIIELRYAFIPYSYSEYMMSIEKLKPFISPMFLKYEEERIKEIEDQYMYGESLMIAPIITQNATGRYVHLPENKWLFWNASKYNERKLKVYNPGDYYVKADLFEIPLFIKENSIIVLTKPQNYIGEKEIEKLNVIAFVTEKSEYTYYEDDGETYNYKDGDYAKLKIEIAKDNTEYKIVIEKDESEDYKLKIKELNFEIYDKIGNVFTKKMEI